MAKGEYHGEQKNRWRHIELFSRTAVVNENFPRKSDFCENFGNKEEKISNMHLLLVIGAKPPGTSEFLNSLVKKSRES